MKPHRMSRWARLITMAALVPTLAWAQDGPNGRIVTVEPGDPVDRTGGVDLFTWDVMDLSSVAPGSTLGTLWVNTRSDAFVWATRPRISVTPGTQSVIIPEDPPAPPFGGPSAQFTLTSSLLRYDGTNWTPVLNLENEEAATLFGTHPNGVYAATNAPDGTVRVYRFNGNRWRTEQLPEGITGPAGDFAGNQARLFFRAGDKILMAVGPHWTVVYENALLNPGHALVVLNRNQIVAPGINGQAVWDGVAWTWEPIGWDMDVHGAWGGRDAAGELHMFVTGHGPEERGMCVSQFVEGPMGGLHGAYVETMAEPAADPHSGLGIEAWGSGVHDVYLVGRVHDEGFIERFNGVGWSKLERVPAITTPTSVAGTPEGDVWVALRDGRVLRGMRREPLVTPIDESVDDGLAPAPSLTVRRESPRAFVIEYGLTEGRHVDGAVFNVSGRRIATLENEYREAGTYQVRWDARDVPPGVYFYRVRAGSVAGAGRMIVVE